MLTKDDFNITDPRLKDEAWAKRIIQYLVYNRVPLTNGRNVAYLRSWQNSRYDVKEFKRPYLHLLPKSEGGDLDEHEAQKALKIDFTQLGLFELTKNILSGEITKEQIYIDADCFDPSIIIAKEKEFDLLRNKKGIEDTINGAYAQIGIPSDYKVGDEGEFKSNMDEFESMGLSPDNEEDIEFFSGTFWRHDLEAYATQIINEINNINELSEIQKNHINDIITLKAIAMQTYYNESTGLPTTRYLFPENCYYSGNVTRNDMKDAISLSWSQTMSISDFLKMVGDNKFTKDDYNELVMLAGMNTSFPYGIDFTCSTVRPEGYCTWQDFFRFNVNVGYIEWKTNDRNELGRYFQKTMKAYYLCDVGGQLPYKLYKYGYLNVQAREGYELEQSCFSISVYRLEGKSMLEISIPYFKRIFSDWLKYQWMMESAKPMGYAYEIGSLQRVANLILNGTGQWNDVIELIKMFKRSPDMFYSLGDEESEQKIGGSGLPYQAKQNGVDPSAVKFLESIQWCKQQIMEETGLNNARIAQSPSVEEAYKKTQLVTNQSENATEYVNTSISSIYSSSGYRIFSIVQSIAEFELFGYEQLEQIFGERYIDSVEYLKNIPITYFGINIRRFLRDREREEIRQFTTNAVLKGEIPEEIGLLINDIDDFKKAARVLSFYKERTRKQQLQAQKEQNQAQLEIENAKTQGKLAIVKAEGEITLAKQKMIEQGLLEQTRMIVEGKINQQQIRLDTQPMLNENKSNLKKDEETHRTALNTTKEIVNKDGEK